MADDKHYVGGQWYRICDRTGFKIRNVATAKQWDNLIVRTESYEPRQPQDFVRGVIDDQIVTDPRPRQPNSFQGPLTTTTTATLAIGAQIVPVQSSLRMLIGDNVWIMMDNGQVQKSTITDIPSITSIQINPALSWKSSSGSQVTDVSAVTGPKY